MKKFIALACALLMVFALFACIEDEPTPGTVRIYYVADGQDVIKAISTQAADYGYIAEPAATTALSNANVLAKIENKRIDIQAEWKALTDLDGYPQASLFVKDGTNAAIVQKFLAAAESAGEWAIENPADAVTVIKANPLEGSEITMPNITDSAVVERCNIYSKTDNLKSYIDTFLDKVGITKPSNDNIYYDGVGEGSASEINVYMPDGATALALAYMMENYDEIDGVKINYNVAPAASIASFVASEKADIILLPTNAAINLYNAGAKYKIASVMTHGNLFIIGADNLDDLDGKTIAAIGKGNIPGLVLTYILTENNITVDVGE